MLTSVSVYHVETHILSLTCLLYTSTLLRTLSASQPSLAGDLQLLGKPLQHYSEKERSRTIGVVLTDKTQAGGLTAVSYTHRSLYNGY